MLPAPTNGARPAGRCNSRHLQFFGKGSLPPHPAARTLRAPGAARPLQFQEQLPKKLFPAEMIPEIPQKLQEF